MPHIPGKKRPNAWVYRDSFDHARHFAWHRSRAQANFRGEAWELSPEEFFELWSTPELWSQRGRRPEHLVLTRYDWEKPWSRSNCCIITRYNQLLITKCRKMNQDCERYYQDPVVA